MKILFLSDEECKAYWDYFRKEDFVGIDLIVSCGDLDASYLSFLATMNTIPVLYVRGNHDDKYEKNPPEGCICIEDTIYEYEGVRFLGLGGSYRYNPGMNQYTEADMKRRVRKLWLPLRRSKGFDVLVTHAPAFGFHDEDNLCHRGFETFIKLIEKYRPALFVHGHVHLRYGKKFPREDWFGDTRVINASERYIVELCVK